MELDYLLTWAPNQAKAWPPPHGRPQRLPWDLCTSRGSCAPGHPWAQEETGSFPGGLCSIRGLSRTPELAKKLHKFLLEAFKLLRILKNIFLTDGECDIWQLGLNSLKSVFINLTLNSFWWLLIPSPNCRRIFATPQCPAEAASINICPWGSLWIVWSRGFSRSSTWHL